MRRFALGLSLLISACSSFTGDPSTSPPDPNDAGGSDGPDANRPADAGADAAKEPDATSDAATPTLRRLFVTTAKFNGMLSGGALATATCKTAAQTAGLPGSFDALLGGDAITKLIPGGAQVVDINGKPLFRREDGVSTTPNLASRVLDDEGKLSTNQVWTGSNNVTCNGWTSSAANVQGGVGKSTDLTASWFDQGPANCDMLRSVYCIQVSE